MAAISFLSLRGGASGDGDSGGEAGGGEEACLWWGCGCVVVCGCVGVQSESYAKWLPASMASSWRRNETFLSGITQEKSMTVRWGKGFKES